MRHQGKEEGQRKQEAGKNETEQGQEIGQSYKSSKLTRSDIWPPAGSSSQNFHNLSNSTGNLSTSSSNTSTYRAIVPSKCHMRYSDVNLLTPKLGRWRQEGWSGSRITMATLKVWNHERILTQNKIRYKLEVFQDLKLSTDFSNMITLKV